MWGGLAILLQEPKYNINRNLDHSYKLINILQVPCFLPLILTCEEPAIIFIIITNTLCIHVFNHSGYQTPLKQNLNLSALGLLVTNMNMSWMLMMTTTGIHIMAKCNSSCLLSYFLSAHTLKKLWQILKKLSCYDLSLINMADRIHGIFNMVWWIWHTGCTHIKDSSPREQLPVQAFGLLLSYRMHAIYKVFDVVMKIPTISSFCS